MVSLFAKLATFLCIFRQLFEYKAQHPLSVFCGHLAGNNEEGNPFNLTFTMNLQGKFAFKSYHC